MKFWRVLFGVFLSTLYFVLSTASAKAENEFSVDANVTYKVQDGGRTLVTHDITLENNFSTLYATTYTLSLENISADNIKAFNANGQTLTIDVQKNNGQTNIKLTFPDSVVGKGAKRHFIVTYDNSSFAVRTGEVWEISIPRLNDQNSFRSYQVNLIVPPSFGLEAYISPKPKSSEETNGQHSYIFTKDEITQTGVTAGFGEFQVFSFNLAYHLENPLPRTAETQIALPPDTAFQKVYIQRMDPKPEKVTIDPDGNWLATFRLTSRQRIDVMVTGEVQIFAGFRTFPKPTAEVLSNNLKETQYWQVNAPQIKALALTFKTPRAIYDYVSTTLKYNFDRVQPNVQRMGALSALKRPSEAICMEFTDLFIAIARAAGIPAREINGYAYTENPELQPLSLVADVLHSWPEYYDKDKGVWIPIDPTWGSTTGGVDFFSKLDLRHFAFVIHGGDAVKPYAPGSYKLGPNPQKDVFVSFGKLPRDRISLPVLTISPKRTIPFLSYIYTVKINNPGPAALYSVYPSVYFDGVLNNRDFMTAFKNPSAKPEDELNADMSHGGVIALLPPYSTYEMTVTVPFSLLGKSTPDIVKIMVGESQIQISTNKSQVIVNSLLVLSFILVLVMLTVLVRLKKITFKPITAKIGALYARFARKPFKNSNNP